MSPVPRRWAAWLLVAACSGAAGLSLLACSGDTGADSQSDETSNQPSPTSDDGAVTTESTIDEAAETAPALDALESEDWEGIYRDLVEREQQALVANDLDALESTVTGRRLESLAHDVELRRFRGYVLDDSGVDRTVDRVELAEIVETDHVVLHVAETRRAAEVIRSADGTELHAVPYRSEPSHRIQVDLDLVEDEWRVEHQYHLGDVGGIEPLPDQPPAVTVEAEGHTVEIFSWLAGDDRECMGFDGTRPDGTGIGDWSQCRPIVDFEPPADEFTWQILPLAGDDAPLIHLAVSPASLNGEVVLDDRSGTVAERPNGGAMTVWLQTEPGQVFRLATRSILARAGRLGITPCGATRRIGRYPDDLQGSFGTLADIADAAAEQLRTLEWQAGSITVDEVLANRFTVVADDVDHETSSYRWEWRFARPIAGRGLELQSIHETRICR